MLYLAQVHKNAFLDQYQLHLLARQESENFWLTIAESDSVVLAIETLILLGKANAISNNLLVLVELSPTLQNQDLARRSLELEARREQIEALEESIKRERNAREKTEG